MTDFSADLRRLLGRISATPRTRDGRSPLFIWMLERADLLRRVLEDDGAPTWDALAGAIAEHGLIDGEGKAASPLRVRKTWLAVRRKKGWLAPRPVQPMPRVAAPAPPPIAPAPMPPPARVAPTVTPPPAADDDNRARVERFRREIALRSGRNL